MKDSNIKISKDLVGVNAHYELLKKPSKPAYPKGQEVKYYDNYLNEINAIYSLDNVLGERKEKIAEGNKFALNYFTMDTLFENSEGEHVLNLILYQSAQAKAWQPIIIEVGELKDTQIKTSEEYLQEISKINPEYNKGKINGGLLFGIATAQRHGFVATTKNENRVIVLPTQEFIEYCSVKN